MKVQKLLTGINAIKNKGLRNQNLNPWPVLIMLGLLVIVMIACAICK